MKPFRIILADDDPDDEFFFKQVLEEISIPCQIHLTIAADGETLMNHLDNVQELPNVIFLDLNMPRKSGSECLMEIRKVELIKDIPVVIYSTAFLPEVADVLYEMGANYYIQKCNFPELTGCLSKVLSSLMNGSARPSRNGFLVNKRPGRF